MLILIKVKRDEFINKYIEEEQDFTEEIVEDTKNDCFLPLNSN